MVFQAMIAMSGGVDSSVAAWLTQQAGFFCVGATMQLLDGSGSEAADARAIAQRLGMPFHILDMRITYSHNTISRNNLEEFFNFCSIKVFSTYSKFCFR